jgi:hypothetical protein
MTSKFDNLVPEAGLLAAVRAMYEPNSEELNEGSPNLGPQISYDLARARRAKDKKYSPKFAKQRAEYEQKMHAANRRNAGPNAAPLHFASGSSYNQQEETDLEIAQAINELSADTIRSYAGKARDQVNAPKPRGRQPAALKKTLEKRQSGLDIVNKKRGRELDKERADRDAKHSAMMKDLHSKLPGLIKSHGYTKVHSADLPSGTKATMYQKPHEGAAVITHVTHFQRTGDDNYKPVVKFSGSGNVSSSSDDYRVNKLFRDETPSTEEHLKNISDEIKSAERRHASHSMNESVEQIDELSKNKLTSYLNHMHKQKRQFRKGTTPEVMQKQSKSQILALKKTGKWHPALGPNDAKVLATEEELGEAVKHYVMTTHGEHRVVTGGPNSKTVKAFPYGDTQSKQTSSMQHAAAYAFAKKMNAGIKKPARGQRRDIAMEEDVEAIDELSKNTLGSYIKKASDSAASKAVEYGKKKTERDEVDRLTNRHMRYDDKEKIHKALNTTSDEVEAPRRKAAKRLGGINRAVTKLTKEETLDELSKGLLNRYKLGNERDRENLASGLWYPKGEAGATEKQKKDSAKLDKRMAGTHLASKKLYPNVWNPKQTGKPGARVHATEEVVELDESVAKVRKALEAPGSSMYPDSIGKNKDGHIVVRKGFYYKHGRSAEAQTAKIKRALDDAGIKHTIVKDGEHNAPFRGGASVGRQSHFYTHIKLHEDAELDLLNSIDEKTLTSAELKKREEIVKAVKRGNPKMDKSMAYAIATKTAKRVAEESEEIDEDTKVYDAHYDKQTDAVKNRLNHHLRNGLSYPEAVEKTRRVGSPVKGCTPLKEAHLDEEQIKRGRGRPKKNPEPGEDTQEGPEALGYQLRKARSIGKPVTFLDGSQHKVEHKHGMLFDIHMDHRKTSKEKQEFQNAAHASHADFVKQVTAPLPTTHEGGGTGEIMRYSTSNDRFGRHQRY